MDANCKLIPINNLTRYIRQTIMTYALNLLSDLSKLYLSKTGGKVLKKTSDKAWRKEGATRHCCRECKLCSTVEHHEGFLKD